MQIRPRSLEVPDRHPYIRVACSPLGVRTEYVLRVPSLHQVATLAKIVSDEQRRALFGLSAVLTGGVSLGVAAEVLRQGGAGMVELVGALIGVSWRDPRWALETPPPMGWDPESTRAYGAAVADELHEAGWGLAPILACALAIVTEIVKATELDEEVRERAALFLGRTAPPTAGSSRPNASSSADGSAPSDGAS